MAYPRFKDSEAPVGNEDLDAAESAMGIVLPSDLRQLYLKYNGGYPAKYNFPFEHDLYEVGEFFPIKYGDPRYTLDATYKRVREALPAGLIPFSRDAAGNFYCYSTVKETMHSICYWNHELTTWPNHGVTVLADSLDEFLHGMVNDPDA